jgi:hypothetical protein
MARLIVVLVILGLAIYAFIDCLRTPAAQVRALPRPLWLIVIVLLTPLGPVAWILLGRADDGPAMRRRRPRVLAPDDDPDFLRSLDPPPRPKTAPEDRPEPGE